jgi:molybdopterin converting factor subunit 1
MGAERDTGEIHETATVTVLFFAGAREAAGTARSTLPAAGTTVADLAAMLASSFGDRLGAVLGTAAVWVNGEPAPPAMVLRAGDEVAVLPPVSGGCAEVPSVR